VGVGADGRGAGGARGGAPRLSPSEVGAGFDAVSVDPGGRHAVGRTTAGQWQSWGDNAEGALCLGSGAGRGAPTDVAAPFSAVAAGGGFSLAVAAGGALWGCGAWEVGQRGTGRALRVTLPREGP
jgi:alpha-tubulin suppressor-like RCC1 family protein